MNFSHTTWFYTKHSKDNRWAYKCLMKNVYQWLCPVKVMSFCRIIFVVYQYDNFDCCYFWNWIADLCAARHWQACSRPETLWTGAGGTLPDIPPLWSECWEPWPGDWGPGSYSGKLPASAAPQSPEPAPTTAESAGGNVYETQTGQAKGNTVWETVCFSCIQI